MCPREFLQGSGLRGGPPPLPREGSGSPLPPCGEGKATAAEKSLFFSPVGQNSGWGEGAEKEAGWTWDARIGPLVGCFFFHAKNSPVLVVSQEGFRGRLGPLGLLLALAAGQPLAGLHP